MTDYGVITDYEYNSTHKRERLTIWSGAFASTREGEAYSLPKNAGYMVTLEYGDKLRVSCPAPRTAENYLEVDKAISEAITAYYNRPETPKTLAEISERLEKIREAIDSESISYGEIAELQGLAEHIEPGDVQLLEWAGVPEFPENS